MASDQAGLTSAAPTATIADHKMTGAEPASNCASPVAKSSFAPTDERVYQWILVNGATAGDVITWDFRQPNGSTYFQTNPVTVSLNGNVCFWAFINIAGFEAASLPGLWEVRFTYNGALLATDTFTIRSGPAVLTDHRVTGTAPLDCTPPQIKTTFAPTDARVYQWTLVSGALAGDQVRWEFIQPNGSVYLTSATLSLSGGGNRCFWVGIDIAGTVAATLPGNWQVRVIYNDLPLLPTPDTFTITQQTCPTLGNVSPTSGVVGSSTTITGTNFTGVTAVRFNNNIAANFSINNASTITATVPAGAVTGPITLVKPGCADVQTPAFTVKLQPVIEVTPPTLSFGNVRTGERATTQLKVRNIGNAPLLISSITSSNPQFAISLAVPAFGLQPGGSVDLKVNFAPDSGGIKSGTLAINSNDPVR
ncbi:MAG: choice-of-anchor D domain-containing protein, partial [Acidobacteriota bacterium]